MISVILNVILFWSFGYHLHMTLFNSRWVELTFFVYIFGIFFPYLFGATRYTFSDLLPFIFQASSKALLYVPVWFLPL